MIRFAAALASALPLVPVLFGPGAARAQSPVTIVVNFGPGAGNDVAARIVAAEFAGNWARPSW